MSLHHRDTPGEVVVFPDFPCKLGDFGICDGLGGQELLADGVSGRLCAGPRRNAHPDQGKDAADDGCSYACHFQFLFSEVVAFAGTG